MASKSIALQVRPRGKRIPKLPETITVVADAPVSEIYDELSAKTKYSVHRLRVTKGSDGTYLPREKNSIYSTGLRNESVVFVKDLGAQINWTLAFIIEYLGPLLIHPAFLYLRPYFYKSPVPELSYQQTLFFALVTLHFLKRELEMVFVHRYSLATLPLKNAILKNWAHYWILSGLNLAPWVYSPSSPAAADSLNPTLLYTGIALYLIGELGNLSSHLTLRGLRSAGGKERGIPQGIFFNMVTCPNYMFETIAWIGMFIISSFSWSLVVFIIAGVGQMAIWAKKKERRYRKDFGDRYKKKKFVILPGLY